ncbi:hypothetical protein [Kitasatospora sp. GP82]|uniref:hypothetical protein n=1 Tax=Kitasatospora sp. GP82 TaxID=3035089 RepID=UPI002476D2F7|nr:hypothetical protein [Kitasatospora sp. GP82]
MDSELSRTVEQAMLALAAGWWSNAEIARATGGKGWWDMEKEIRKQISVLLHPSRVHHLAQLADGVPKGLINQIEKLERALLRTCATCHRDVLRPAGPFGGRPRKHCSAACRQAAYRARRKTAAPAPAVPPQKTDGS